MPQITEAQRVERIRLLLAELNKVPPERHEVIRLPDTGGEPRWCQVINISVDEVLLNHRSHRVRAQLEDDPDWEELSKDPHSETAQRLVERHVAKARNEARKDEDLAALKESLLREGQTHPGVMTHRGVLINANTRAVALRQVEDPAKRYIRVAVLPETIDSGELALLELRLQMQKELKVDYSLTNELLFIEELSTQRGLPDGQIARELRIGENAKKGENEVRERLQMLDLIRHMQRIPREPLRLTFFDRISYQQLRDLHSTYHALLPHDPDAAQRHLESFLLSVAVGVYVVHQIRSVDHDFVRSYMLPQLQDEYRGEYVARLATPAPEDAGKPEGVDALLTDDGQGDENVNIRSLINAVTQRDNTVYVPGTPLSLPREDVTEAVRTAIITGIKDKKRDAREADKLQAPVEAVKDATRRLVRCTDSLKEVIGGPDFDDRRRKTLEAAFKKLRRTYRSLEAELIKAEVISK